MQDSFNEGMLYITHFVFLHDILRRSQMLLTYNRLPDDVVLCAEVTYNNKVKNKIKHYTSDHFQIVSDLQFISKVATIIFILFF